MTNSMVVAIALKELFIDVEKKTAAMSEDNVIFDCANEVYNRDKTKQQKNYDEEILYAVLKSSSEDKKERAYFISAKTAFFLEMKQHLSVNDIAYDILPKAAYSGDIKEPKYLTKMIKSKFACLDDSALESVAKLARDYLNNKKFNEACERIFDIDVRTIVPSDVPNFVRYYELKKKYGLTFMDDASIMESLSPNVGIELLDIVLYRIFTECEVIASTYLSVGNLDEEYDRLNKLIGRAYGSLTYTSTPNECVDFLAQYFTFEGE